MKLALCQMEIHLYDPDKNLSKMLEMLEVPADLYVFPETCLTGFDGTSKILDFDLSPYYSVLQKTGKSIVFGGVMNHENVALYVSNGRLLGRYSKLHLFSHGGEDAIFKVGNSHVVWEFENVKILPQVCYDLRFPAEIYSHAGEVDIVIFSANWPAERVEHWDVLLKARAIENQRFVVGVNCVGTHRWRYNGHSAAYDPWGRRLAFLDEEERVEVVEIDTDLVSKIALEFNTRKDYRPEMLGGAPR